MGRRFEAAVRPQLPQGVREPVVIGLANNYMGYLTTPEEYEMQHYEGGHTVFGIYTSFVVRDSLVALSRALATGQPAPEPDAPAALGGTDPGAFPQGDAEGAVVEEPTIAVSRLDTVSVAWEGTANGVDRPVDRPFVAVERLARGKWRASDSDLGLAFIWREEGGSYYARWEVPASQPPGAHRLRIRSSTYDLKSRAFSVRRSAGLRLRGVLAKRSKRRTRLIVVAQNPPPDPDRAILWRAVTPTGGKALLRLGKRRLVARWDRRRLAWVATVRGRVRKGRRVTVIRARDGFGNSIGGRARVRVGRLAPLAWPDNIGTGDGRTPGPLGEGNFPP